VAKSIRSHSSNVIIITIIYNILSRRVWPVFLHPFLRSFLFIFICRVRSSRDLRTWPPFLYIIHNITVQYYVVVGIIIITIIIYVCQCRVSQNIYIYIYIYGTMVLTMDIKKTRIVLLLLISITEPKRDSQNGKHIQSTRILYNAYTYKMFYFFTIN
jgi:hypothetical protein